MYNDGNNTFQNTPPAPEQSANVNPGTTTPNQSFNNGYSGTYKFTITRQKDFYGSMVSWKIFVDGVNVGQLKNGESITFDITSGTHTIAINKRNPISMEIVGNTTAEGVIYGTNNFALINFNGQPGNPTLEANIKKANNYATMVMIIDILLAVIGILLLFAGYYLKLWLYAVAIADSVINLPLVKKFGENENTKKMRTKHIAGIVIAAVMLVISCYFINIYAQ